MKKAVSKAILLCAVVLASAACSSNRSALPPLLSVQAQPATSDAAPGVTPNGGRNLGTIPPSTPVPTAASAPLSGAGPTACTFEAIHASTGLAPAGITDIDLRCVGDWASWVGQANDPTTSDGYFAVATRTATGWKTVNLGTAGVCTDGGVPQELWTALNCAE